MRVLHAQELRDIVTGAGLLGAGGGGSTAEGLQLVSRVLEFGPGVKLATVEELSDDAWGAVIAGVGSPKASLTRVRTHSPAAALGLLEKSAGFTASFVVPFELGAGNSINPMLAAVQRDLPIVDGDPAARAVPELQMTTFSLGGIPLTPLALATEDPISAVIRTEAPRDAERVARAITAELGGVAAIACHALKGRDVKKHIIPGTTTLVLRLGATIREAKGNGDDVARKLADEYRGVILGRGRISSLRAETSGAFDYGVTELSGKHQLRVFLQNENIVAFRDGQLVAMAPDLICCIGEQGNPLTNADLAEGMDVTFLGFPAPAQLRTPQGTGLFAHVVKALGCDEPFTPLERLAQR